MNNKYDANSIITLSPREAVRQSLGMYIGSNDSVGMHHLFTEIVANAMDEAAAGYGNKIIVGVEKNDNSITIRDYGRGIPFHKNNSGKYAIIEMCTNLHSGGKFEQQSNYKSSLGLNGVGATVTCALSKKFRIQVWRDKEYCDFYVEDGKYNPEPHIEPYSGKEQGTLVSFIPDEEIFGQLKWDVEKIKDELQLHALLNNGVTFQLLVDGKLYANFNYMNGIKDMLRIKTEGLNLLSDVVYFKTHVENDSANECDVEMAFCYCDRAYETVYSFVNGGYTPNDGTHVTGFRTGYTNIINKMAREAEILKDKDKNFSGDIIRKGLVLVLSIKMTERPMFAEQTKLTLNSPSARGFCSKAVGQLVLDKKIAKQIFDKISIEQKAEEAAQRKREAQEKIARGGKSMNSLRDLPEKLADAREFSDAELFLVEGDSAASGCKSTKLANQAVLPLRGKIKNTCGLELADIIKSEVIKDLLTVLGCGIGDNFNINNLRYNRIIILSDADPDGNHIQNLIATLFLYHLPKIIEAGKLYISVPPLFKTQTAKEIKYWESNNSELKKYIRNHSKVEVIRLKGLGEMNAPELFSTTMDPANRKLIQLTTDNMEETLELYDKLMGKSPFERRKFIMSNRLNTLEMEEVFDDEDVE